jgi:hypothetical protein
MISFNQADQADEDEPSGPEQPRPAPPEPEQPTPQPPHPEIPPSGPEEPRLPSPGPEPLPTPVPGPTDPGLPHPVLGPMHVDIKSPCGGWAEPEPSRYFPRCLAKSTGSGILELGGLCLRPVPAAADRLGDGLLPAFKHFTNLLNRAPLSVSQAPLRPTGGERNPIPGVLAGLGSKQKRQPDSYSKTYQQTQ